MDNINQIKQIDDQLGLGITETSFQYLRETAKWTRLLAILNLSFILLYFVFGLLTVFNSNSPGASFLILIALSIPLLLVLIPLFYLYKFSENLKISLETNSQPSYTEAFRFFRSFYKYIGIFTLVVLIFYFFVFCIMLAGVLVGSN